MATKRAKASSSTSSAPVPQRSISAPTESPPELITGLPDDVALRCLARVPRIYHHKMAAVSTRWRALVRGTESGFYELRKELGFTNESIVLLEMDDFTLPSPASIKCFEVDVDTGKVSRAVYRRLDVEGQGQEEDEKDLRDHDHKQDQEDFQDHDHNQEQDQDQEDQDHDHNQDQDQDQEDLQDHDHNQDQDQEEQDHDHNQDQHLLDHDHRQDQDQEYHEDVQDQDQDEEYHGDVQDQDQDEEDQDQVDEDEEGTCCHWLAASGHKLYCFESTYHYIREKRSTLFSDRFDHHVFDTLSKTYVRGLHAPGRHNAGPAYAVVDEKLYVTSGFNVDVLDTRTGTWSQGASVERTPDSEQWFSAFYVLGGDIVVEDRVYSTRHNRWEELDKKGTLAFLHKQYAFALTSTSRTGKVYSVQFIGRGEQAVLRRLDGASWKKALIVDSPFRSPDEFARGPVLTGLRDSAVLLTYKDEDQARAPDDFRLVDAAPGVKLLQVGKESNWLAAVLDY